MDTQSHGLKLHISKNAKLMLFYHMLRNKTNEVTVSEFRKFENIRTKKIKELLEIIKSEYANNQIKHDDKLFVLYFNDNNFRPLTDKKIIITYLDTLYEKYSGCYLSINAFANGKVLNMAELLKIDLKTIALIKDFFSYNVGFYSKSSAFDVDIAQKDFKDSYAYHNNFVVPGYIDLKKYHELV